jgi:hypothetical protein
MQLSIWRETPAESTECGDLSRHWRSSFRQLMVELRPNRRAGPERRSLNMINAVNVKF